MKKKTGFSLFGGVLAAAVYGLLLGVSDGQATTATLAKCGDDSLCYSVPDGCGEGVGCQTAFCWMEECPSILGGSGVCKFCDDPPE